MPSPGEDIQIWSKVAADNGTADPLIDWHEFQTRASVNNSSRGELAAHAKHRDLNNGSITTSGTANAQTFLSGVSYTSMPARLTAKLKIGGGLTNTGPTTLNMDGIGAYQVKHPDGTNFRGGEFTDGRYVDVLWDGTGWTYCYNSGTLNLGGDPQAVTPTNPLDADKSIATTEWVQGLIFGGDGIILAQRVYATPGTYNWTPSGAMRSCIIEVVAGGGAGGDAASSPGSLLTGGGGGSGGYSRKFASKADIDALGGSLTVIVGAGGVGGPIGQAGFPSSVGAICIANGGSGGGRSLNGDAVPFGGAGGAAGTGDIVAAGSPGEQGGYVINDTIPPTIMGGGGRGGSSYFGGGGQIASVGTSGSAAGIAAGNYGSGGSGAVSNQTGGYNGVGSGSGGLVVITEYSGTGAIGPAGPAGPVGPPGPAGPAGPGGGDVSHSGTITAGQWAQWVDGTHIASVPAPGGGNVSSSGTPTAGQVAVWTDASHIQGVAAASVGFTTGDAKLTLKNVADTGWVLMNDGTIGSASSGSSTRANADTQSLFTLLFTNINDANAPILTSAGAATTRAAQTNAATAWANNCRMTLTRQLGRALAISGAGSGLTSRVLGSYLGEEAHVQTLAEMASHNHSGSATANGYVYSWTGTTITYGSSEANVATLVNSTMATTNGLTIAAAGSSTAANVMQPTSFWNIMIKL